MPRSSKGVLACLLVLAAALVVTPTLAWAQADTGVIDGRVYDQSKAAVPGVTVTARNVSTGFNRSAVSSPTGTYRLEFLPPGTYEVTAEIQGFATMLFKGVVVQVGSSVAVDFTMQVGALTESVTVSGETPLVQTTRSDVGTVINSTMVSNMPLSGRRFQDLSLLVPGTRPANYYDPTKTEVGGISYGGATGRAVNITVDGGDNNDGVVRGLLQQMSADAIQEYKVTTGRYSAEFGRSTGGVVSVVTKSGTNDLRGSGFGFFRDASLNAETYFEKEADSGKQPFSQQQLGGTLGGPISSNRAFFFGSYEYNRRQDYKTVFTNGVLPAEEGPQLAPFRNHLILARTDFRFTDNQSLMVRYSREDNQRENDFIGGNTLKSAGALNTNVIDMVTGKHTMVLGGSKVNEVLVQFQYFENNITANDNSNPAISTPDFTFGANSNTPQQTIQKRWQFKDDFVFRKQGWGGDHDFKVGAEIVQSHYGGFFIPSLYGFFTFYERLPGNDIKAYLNTIADSFSGSAGDNAADDNWTSVGVYFQDDYHPSSRLTLNLGLRWELQTGPYSNDFQTPVLTDLGKLNYNNQRENDTNNFGPRLGFAWDVTGNARTVVRGGYGVYFDEIFQNITLYERWTDVRTPLNFLAFSPTPWTPAYYAANSEAIRDSFIDPTFAGQTMRLTAPDLVQPWAHHLNVGAAHQLTKTIAIDFDYIHSVGKDEIHRWALNRNYSVYGQTLSNQSTRLSPKGVYASPYGQVYVEGNRGRSEFDGLYVTGKFRLPRTQVLTSYAWTKADNLADSFGSQPSDVTNLNWEQDWGPTPNDVTHRFTLGGTFAVWKGLQLSTIVQANGGKPYNAFGPYAGGRGQVRAIDPATGKMFPRNAFRADGFFSWDMRFAYNIPIGGPRVLEAMFEVFNITDHVNFNRDNYVNTYSSPDFGTPTDIINNSQRQAQFGLRFRF
jgi:outer membrane receptor protein involved in Fe transport